MSRNVLPGASRSIAAACSIALCLAALGFKAAFTKEDAPELLVGLQSFVVRPMDEASLVAQARAVFIGIALLACLTGGLHAFRSPKGSGSAEGSYLLLVTMSWKLTCLTRIALASPRSYDTVPNDRVSGH